MGGEATFRMVEVPSNGVRPALWMDGKEAAHGYLYLLKKDLHREPRGILRRVCRGDLERASIGKELVLRVIGEASSRGCYKLVAASRYSCTNLHRLHERLGLRNHGVEFRLGPK